MSRQCDATPNADLTLTLCRTITWNRDVPSPIRGMAKELLEDDRNIPRLPPGLVEVVVEPQQQAHSVAILLAHALVIHVPNLRQRQAGLETTDLRTPFLTMALVTHLLPLTLPMALEECSSPGDHLPVPHRTRSNNTPTLDTRWVTWCHSEPKIHA